MSTPREHSVKFVPCFMIKVQKVSGCIRLHVLKESWVHRKLCMLTMPASKCTDVLKLGKSHQLHVDGKGKTFKERTWRTAVSQGCTCTTPQGTINPDTTTEELRRSRALLSYQSCPLIVKGG